MAAKKKPKGSAGPVVALRPTGFKLDVEPHPESAVSWNPAVDVYETEEHYVVNAEVPGVEPEDLRIEVAGSDLSIHGERRFDAVCSQESYFRLEALRGPFTRTFSLPEALDHAKIRVNFSNGVLELILPKRKR